MFNDNDFMGGIFDFNHDGKTTLDEKIVAYKIYEDVSKEESTDKYKPFSKPVYVDSGKSCSGWITAIVIICLMWMIVTISSSCEKSNSCHSNSYHSYSSSNYNRNSSSGSYNSYSSKKYETTDPTTKKYTYNYNSSSKSKKSASSDPYNAKDYYDAEDFYEDNYDDFWDYEDAEDYYNEHQDD